MSLTCLMLGAATVMLAAPEFTLDWTHSVERVQWRENWRVTGTALVLDRSAIRGSGAGMEPGPDATLQDGWWVSPGRLQVPELRLAASGATGGGWRFCADGRCRDIGTTSGPSVVIAPCGADRAGG